MPAVRPTTVYADAAVGNPGTGTVIVSIPAGSLPSGTYTVIASVIIIDVTWDHTKNRILRRAGSSLGTLPQPDARVSGHAYRAGRLVVTGVSLNGSQDLDIQQVTIDGNAPLVFCALTARKTA